MARHRLATLRYAEWQRRRHAGALKIQRCYRGHRGRVYAAWWKQQELERRSARSIQRAYRCYNIRHMYRKERRRRATLRIQVTYRGYRGRRRAYLRQQAFHHVAQRLYHVCRTDGLARATRQHYACVQIQRSFRFHQVRCVVQQHRQFWSRKRRYFPARVIQVR